MLTHLMCALAIFGGLLVASAAIHAALCRLRHGERPLFRALTRWPIHALPALAGSLLLLPVVPVWVALGLALVGGLAWGSAVVA